MKQIKLIFSAALCALLFFTACEKTDNDKGYVDLSGLVILNEGSLGSNNSSVFVYSSDEKGLVNAFENENQKALGDTGQDIIVYGNDIYIAVSESQIIFVTDKNFKIKKEITAEVGGNKLSPRHFTTGGGKVYVTYYEGYLGEIDPSEYSVRTTAVGPNPEGVAYAGGRLYVANSGGMNYPDYDNTVSVVDASEFTETMKIEVNLNPCLIFANASETTLYVNSLGNYGDVSSKLEAINVSDNTVSDTGYTGVSTITYGKNDKLYVLCGEYDASYSLIGTIMRHNAATNEKEGTFASNIEKAYKISADLNTGYVFASSSDYINTGDMYIFNASGKQIANFDTQGINPNKGLILQ